MKLILHIGIEKTATTTIQNYLYDNRNNFVENGTYIIRSLGQGNNRDLVSCAMNNEHFDDYHLNKDIASSEDKIAHDISTLKRLEYELDKMPSNINKVVISSEQFHSRLTNDEEVFKLKSILNSYFSDIKVIVYLRPQVEVLVSLYSTIIKSGGKINFNDFIEENPKNLVEYYDYKGLLEKWGKVFGDSNLIPKIFNKKNLKDNNIVNDFCATSGISLFEYNSNYLNESLTPISQEIIRLCNLNGTSSYLKIKNRILSDSNSYGKGQSLTSCEALKLQSKYDDDNNALSKRWFNRSILFNIDFEKYENKSNISSKDSEILCLTLQSLSQINDEEVDIIRDSALELENENLNLCIALLKIAEKKRPNGLFIKKKLAEISKC